MAQAVHAQQKGEFAQAERLYMDVLKEQPEHADALHFLGLLKHQRDGSAESIELMRKSLEYGLPNAGYMANFARVLQAHGRVQESIGQFKKAIALSPSFTEAWNGLGESYELLQMQFKACDCYRKAYAIDPSVASSAMKLAHALRTTGELTEAASLCAATLQANPEEWQFLYMEVLCLLDAGKAGDALERIRAALHSDPLSAQLHYSMGLVLAELGKFDEAKEHFAKALAIDPQYYQVYYSLAAIQNTPTESGDVAALEQRLKQSPPKTPEAAVSAEFSLGKMLDDMGEYDRAFSHFDLGSKIMHRLVTYSTADQTAYVESLMNRLDERFIARGEKIGSESEVPVFIVGMVRSGTSLVEQILTGHPALAGGGELPFLPQSMAKYTEGANTAIGDAIAALPDEALQAMAGRYLEKVTTLYPNAQRVTDKLPGNFMLLGLIRTLFPKARIIHCLRDPLDTCLSCYLTHFDSGHQYSYDMTEIGEYYRLYARMLDFYQGMTPSQTLLTVKYEDLVGDIAGWSRRMVEFCGLDWDPSCIEFNKKQRPVKTASLYQVRQPVYTRSVGRWRHYAAHIRPLQDALARSAKPG